jgi:hypothetical protein
MAGRPEHNPTPEQRDVVVKLVGCKTPHKAIATRLGIDEKTLRKHYREELDRGFDLYYTEVWYKFATLLVNEPNERRVAFYENHLDKVAAANNAEEALGHRPAAVGKKQQKVITAANAEKGTDWEALLRPNKDVH